MCCVSVPAMPPVQGRGTVDGRLDETETVEHTASDASTANGGAGLATGVNPAGRPSLSGGLETVASSAHDGRPALAPGERLGRFTIERQLGAGGMGQVFAARDPAAPGGEIVALKYLEASSASVLYRFKLEFRSLSGVTHENLVALRELVVLPDEGTFFTMELVDGVSFDAYVRGRTPPGELPDMDRLRDALSQLVTGVQHLHQHDCIHRDLKPSNVLVTNEGRVVILDFGLIQDQSLGRDENVEEHIMGTPAYMAPEQAGLERAVPASDYYAVGVMLYECLTGARPFEGTVTHLLFAKREYDAPDLSTVMADAPVELVEICARLLSRNPKLRPGGAELLAALGAEVDSQDSGSSMSASSLRPLVFVGRERELEVLWAGWTRTRARGRLVTVHIRGRSGYGKSALVREFLAGLRRGEGEGDGRPSGAVTVLRGRCFERESVPYKGIDAVIDALSVRLRGMSRDLLTELRPAYPEALVRLFPVLGDLWADEGRSLVGLEAHELRQRAFAALGDLFSALARVRPLVVFIDDFQWANIDSVRLLNKLLGVPEAPPMLLVVAYRDEVESNEILQSLTSAEALEGRDVSEVSVGPLSDSDASELASALMGEERDQARAHTYVAGAEGSPFYLGQMVRGASAEGAGPGQLDQLVVQRIHALAPDSRRLLEVVAVAAAPLAREVAARVAALGIDDELVTALRDADLLRVRGPGRGRKVTFETTHARIREVTVAEMSPAKLEATHLRVAQALERVEADAETLAQHYAQAGDAPQTRTKAADYYARAAEQAVDSMAFSQAASLFRRALVLLEAVGADADQVLDLRGGLAEQLMNVGRGHEAAQLLLRMAEGCGERYPARARGFRRRAADQLIKTGHVDAGLAELDLLLQTVGLRLPRAKAAALSALVWEQTRLKIRGFEFVQRDAAEIEPQLLDQIDTCMAVVTGLSTQEVLLSAMFHLRALRLSLIAGEPSRVARALAYQCVIEVAGGDWRRVEGHLEVARKLAVQVGDADPGLRAFIDVCEASVHWFERRYPTSTRLHTRLLETSEGVPAAVWDRRTANGHHMFTLVMKGRYKAFRARASGAIERARERGDMQEMIEVSAFESIVRVLTGDPEGGERLLAEALADWRPGRYLFGDVWCFYGEVRALLWRGEPEHAVALAKETIAQMRRTLLDQNLLARNNVLELLCRSYLVAALLRDNQGYARRARRLSAKLRTRGNPVLTAHAAVIDAGLATLVGERARALACWAEAEALFAEFEMAGHLAAVQLRRANALGDRGEGPRLAEAAAAYLDSEDMTSPEVVDGFLRVVAPALPERILETT